MLATVKFNRIHPVVLYQYNTIIVYKHNNYLENNNISYYPKPSSGQYGHRI